MHRMDVELGGDEKYEIKLVHHTQKDTWDCGISCILMVMSEKNGKLLSKNLDKISKEEGFDRSTWTIDLCYLLKRFSEDFIFFTTFAGVNPQLRSQYFYEKILQTDADRVTQRFKDALKNGIDVKRKSVKNEDFIKHIKKFGPVILLTNAGFLTCDICRVNNTTSKLIEYLPEPVTYHGHYIVLCGFNLKNKQFYYRNPAHSSRTCAMGFKAMNKARKCFGTDEDCIFIFKNTEQ